MAKFAVLFVATIAFSATWAAPKKNQGGAQQNQLQEIGNQLETLAHDFQVSVQNILPDNKQVVQTISAKTQEFAHEVDSIVNKMKAEIEKNKGSTDTVLQQVTTKLTESIQALQQAAGPDASAKANEFRKDLETNFKNAVTEMEKLGKAVQPNIQHAQDSISTFTKGVMDDFLKSAQNLQNQINNAIQQGQKQKPK